MSISYESVFECVDAAVLELTVRWTVYCELFDDEEGVKLLNASGSYVFFLLQRLLLDDTMIALSRLTDPASSGRDKENASLKNLLQRAAHIVSPATLAEASADMDRLEKHVENVRTFRMKVLAHSDLRHALKVESLPRLTFAELEAAMELCRDLMQKLGTREINRSNGYGPIVRYDAGPSVLLRRLRQAAGFDQDDR